MFCLDVDDKRSGYLKLGNLSTSVGSLANSADMKEEDPLVIDAVKVCAGSNCYAKSSVPFSLRFLESNVTYLPTAVYNVVIEEVH